MAFWNKKKNQTIETTKYKLITDNSNGYYSYNNKIYESDIVRSCIRPKSQAIGKSVAIHLRGLNENLQSNPEPYMRFLLEEPNPLMTGQMLQEKLAVQLLLNNNAFALIVRDENSLPISIYPLDCTSVTVKQNDNGEIFLKFDLINGKNYTFPYSDIIHLRRDYNSQLLLGDSPAVSLSSMMNVVSTTDQGLVKAIKNSNIIRWILKFSNVLKDGDVKKYTDSFVRDYLSADVEEGVGAAGIDAKADLTQVDPKDYVPNAGVMDRTTDRIFAFFNTNKKIIQSSYNEDEWNAYYESEIEPVLIQMSNEFTRKLFTRRERGFGNKIVFSSSSLTFASMQTKLSLSAIVDRGGMNVDEWRNILNLPPLPDNLGQEYIRRLDTQPVKGGE